MEEPNLGPRRRIVALLGGPTGAGKTAAALALARLRGWEILSADSGQARSGLSIGTAAPTEAERTLVRHHLVGDVPADAEDSVALFLDRAETVLGTPGPDLLAVGGAGQHLQALREGLEAGPAPDPALRSELASRLERDGMEPLWNDLRRMAEPPPDARANPVRLLRALEKATLRAAGAPEVRRAPLCSGAPAVALRLERSELHRRLALRLESMLEAGWVREAHRLERTVRADAPCWKCIGYRELLSVPEDGAVPPETVRRILAATRQYARRQETWLRNRLRPLWIDGQGSVEEVAGRVSDAIGDLP